MELLSIKGTESTPKILCSPDSGSVEVYGRSIPENASEFYASFLEWLKIYNKSDKSELRFTFFLDYINSISYKMIFEVLLIAEDMSKTGKEISVLWKYEEGDEEILEEGKIFSDKININFSFEEVPE